MKKPYFLISIILIQLFFFLVQVKNHSLYLNDSKEYLTEAYNISHHGTFYCGLAGQEKDPALFTKRPPLYPLLIALAHLLSSNDMIIILLQNILSVFSILLMKKTAAEWGYLKNKDAWVLAVLIFSPAQFIYS